MIKTIKKVVKERTGCRDICLRLVMYITPKEGQEVLDYYNLMERFEYNVKGYEYSYPF